MFDTIISPAALSGNIQAPPSKSAAHRALICAALCGECCTVKPISGSADMAATLGVLQAMGAQFQQQAEAVRFSPAVWAKEPAALFCRESGSTLRFLLPVAAALGIPAAFSGAGRLPDRPIGALTEQMQLHGVSFSGEKLPFQISGRLTAGEYALPGNISSQFVTGLLFALPLLQKASVIRLTTPLESAGYIDLTIQILSSFGIRIGHIPDGFSIPGGQRYRLPEKAASLPGLGTVIPVEGDWSNAAFWICAAAIGGDVRLAGLDRYSTQGDRAILEIVKQFGGDIRWEGDLLHCRASRLCGCRIDAGPVPDLVPILAVTGAFAEGDTEIYNAARLRIKESDRLAAVRQLVCSLGGDVEEYPDRLVIHGGKGLRGGHADGANDHRIVMSAAVAGAFCREPVRIAGAQAVEKSYPDFFMKLIDLGGRCDVIQMG